MQRYFSNELLSLNGNIIISSFLSAVLPLGLIEPYAQSSGGTDMSSVMIATLMTVGVFVSVHSILHFFTVSYGGYSLNKTLPFWQIYFATLRKIYTTGIYAIASYLISFVLIDFILQETFNLESASRVIAWICAQVVARFIHTKVYQYKR
ncbi:MAG: hypothetical protein WA790_09470 [Sulfitobacter sp.]